METHKCLDEDYNFSLVYMNLKAFSALANSQGEIVFQTAEDTANLIDVCRFYWNVLPTSDRYIWKGYEGDYTEKYSTFDGTLSITELEESQGWEISVIYRNPGDYENYHITECRFIVSPDGEGYTLESFQSAMKQVNREGLEKPNYLASDKGFIKVS